MLAGVLFWRLTPNRRGHSCYDYVVDGSGVLEVDSEQTGPFMLGLGCWREWCFGGWLRSCFGGWLRSDKGIQVSCLLLLGFMFWSLIPDICFMLGLYCWRECCFGDWLQTDKATHVRIMLLTGVVFWRLTPNRQGIHVRIMLLTEVVFWRLTPKRQGPCTLGICCRHVYCYVGWFLTDKSIHDGTGRTGRTDGTWWDALIWY